MLPQVRLSPVVVATPSSFTSASFQTTVTMHYRLAQVTNTDRAGRVKRVRYSPDGPAITVEARETVHILPAGAPSFDTLYDAAADAIDQAETLDEVRAALRPLFS